MSRICLIQCHGGEATKVDAPALSTYNVAEPLGLLCLDAWLRRQGHEVLLLHPHREVDLVLSDEHLFQQTAAFEPDLIGFSAMTNQVPTTARLAARLKRRLPIVPVVIGGDHFSSLPADLAHYPCFDYAVCGEGEAAISWLAEYAKLSHKAQPSLPSGIYRVLDGVLLGSGRSERASNLDLLPHPTRYPGLLHWSEVGMLMWPPRSQQTGMASLYASRGCPYSCSYCNARLVWGKGVGWRSPECVVDELREIKSRYGTNTAFFVDLTFNANRKAVEELCAAIESADLGIAWYVIARPGNPNDHIRVDKELLETMQRAGCIKVGFGVETVSPAIAKHLHRKSGNDYVFQIARWMDELGMLSKAFLIMGHPAEDEAYYRYLEDYLEQLSVDELRISFLTPFPGTPLWKKHKHEIPNRNHYELYTTFRPIIPHPKFAGSELESIRHRILCEYYFNQKYQSRTHDKVGQFPHLTDAFEKFLNDLHAELRVGNHGLLPTLNSTL